MDDADMKLFRSHKPRPNVSTLESRLFARMEIEMKHANCPSNGAVPLLRANRGWVDPSYKHTSLTETKATRWLPVNRALHTG
ncbi:hypothetical protein LX82_01224 [Celeribacter halophilus]|uniref:Uncharacterized protein n=1 Tax=Celeribacter halophilus TaxID=576117 RepID=A0A1I3QMB4_9RHOB|nr:hypothetical protein LX82_01224 [Celeribacter halophilus]SFJ34960.1 hypothetical protein SAMN04488138_10415 [Celeribacter halophilus]